jgi:hypothetical protein
MKEVVVDLYNNATKKYPELKDSTNLKYANLNRLITTIARG